MSNFGGASKPAKEKSPETGLRRWRMGLTHYDINDLGVVGCAKLHNCLSLSTQFNGAFAAIRFRPAEEELRDFTNMRDLPSPNGPNVVGSHCGDRDRLTSQGDELDFESGPACLDHHHPANVSGLQLLIG